MPVVDSPGTSRTDGVRSNLNTPEVTLDPEIEANARIPARNTLPANVKSG